MKAVINSKKFKKMISRQNGIFNSKKGQDALIRLRFDLSQVTMSVYGQKEMLVLSADCDTDKPFDVVFKRDDLPKVDTKTADLIVKVANDKLHFNDDITINDWNYYFVVENCMKGKYKNFEAVKDFSSWKEKLSVDSNELLSAFKAVYPTRMQDGQYQRAMGLRIDPVRKSVYTLDGYRSSMFNIECQCFSKGVLTVPEFSNKTLKSIVGKSGQQLTFYTMPGDIAVVSGDDFTYYIYGKYDDDDETRSLFDKIIGSYNDNKDYMGRMRYDVLVESAKEYKDGKKEAKKNGESQICVISKHTDGVYLSTFTNRKYSASTFSPWLLVKYDDYDIIPNDYIIHLSMRFVSETVSVLDKNKEILLYLPKDNFNQIIIENGNLSIMILPIMTGNYVYNYRCIDDIIKDKKLKDVI